jgi:hypothetical protein
MINLSKKKNFEGNDAKLELSSNYVFYQAKKK